MQGVFLVAAALLAAAPEIELRTLDGSSVRGHLVELDNSQVVVRAESGRVSTALKDLLGAKVYSEQSSISPQPIQVRLVDGSVLHGSSITSSSEGAKLVSQAGEVLNLPLASMRSVQLVELDTETRSRWNELLEKSPAADLIAVRKKEATSTTFLEGVIGAVTDETIEFKLDGDTIPVKRDRVQGFIYYRTQPANVQDPAFVVADHSGGRIAGRTWSYKDGQVNVTALSGLEFTMPLDQIASFDFSSGKLTYLSDLDPISFEWTPYLRVAKSPTALANFYAIRRDRGRTTDALILDGKSYTKGIALASRSTVIYKLPPQSRRLQAIVGIDDACGDRGHVMLTVSGDGRQLFQTTLTGHAGPQTIDLEVNRVSQLRILVDFGEQMDIGDQVNLCEARVTK